MTTPKQVVTYTLSPEAVWSDGQPITSTDFRYTWDQIRNGTDIYDRSGYVEIESVDDSVPNVAVVTFRRPYAKWRGLFGGQYGVLPSHLLQGQDRHAAMKDGYTWSGGPWKIEKWDKGVVVTLVPNDEYFGDQPKLDKVVFRFFADAASELAGVQAERGPGHLPEATDRGDRRHQGRRARRHPDHHGEDGELRGAVDEQRQGAARPPGRPPGDRLRDRSGRDRQGAVRRARRRRGAAEPAGADPGPLRRARGLRRLHPGPRPGEDAHDRRRLDQGCRRGVGQGHGQRASLSVQDHAGRQAPRAHRADPEAAARGGRLRAHGGERAGRAALRHDAPGR